MLLLRSPEDAERVEDTYMSALLTQRLRDIAVPGYAYEELGMFIVVEPGDTVSDIERVGGIWITTGLFGDTKYGEEDFSPSFEVLEAHSGHCFELVFILNDDGYGVIVIVPETNDMDAELMRFCQEYATPTVSPIRLE